MAKLKETSIKAGNAKKRLKRNAVANSVKVTSKDTANSTPHFLRLPFEVRTMIYDAVFIRRTSYCRECDEHHGTPRQVGTYIPAQWSCAASPKQYVVPALLQVNRSIRTEAAKYYYNNELFIISISNLNVSLVSRWLKFLGPNLCHLREVRLQLSGIGGWPNLVDLVAFHAANELFRTCKFYLSGDACLVMAFANAFKYLSNLRDSGLNPEQLSKAAEHLECIVACLTWNTTTWVDAIRDQWGEIHAVPCSCNKSTCKFCLPRGFWHHDLQHGADSADQESIQLLRHVMSHGDFVFDEDSGEDDC